MCKFTINIKIEKLQVTFSFAQRCTHYILFVFTFPCVYSPCACKFLQVAIGCFVLGFGKKLHIAKCALQYNVSSITSENLQVQAIVDVVDVEVIAMDLE